MEAPVPGSASVPHVECVDPHTDAKLDEENPSGGVPETRSSPNLPLPEQSPNSVLLPKDPPQAPSHPLRHQDGHLREPVNMSKAAGEETQDEGKEESLNGNSDAPFPPEPAEQGRSTQEPPDTAAEESTGQRSEGIITEESSVRDPVGEERRLWSQSLEEKPPEKPSSETSYRKPLDLQTEDTSVKEGLEQSPGQVPVDTGSEEAYSGPLEEEYEDGSTKDLSDSTDNTLEDSGDFHGLSSVVGGIPSESSPPPDCILRDEDVTAEGWRARRKHVFVLSEAGKPIYSRYGNEEALSSTMGVMMALVSFVQSGNNAIRSIHSDNQKVVFLQQGPLVLVSVSRAPQSEEQLRQELQYVYYQIISMLTQASVARIFERKKNYDLRRLLAGSEKILDSLLDLLDSEPGFLLGAVRCVALPCPLRDSLSSILTKAITHNLVFSILVAEQQLVTVVQERAVIEDCRLDPADLHLLLNLIGASSAFQAGEIWTPICLPRFNPDGYFYAYISYLDPECTVCLVLLSTDKESFYAVSACKQRIQETMEAQNSLQALCAALRSSSYSASLVGVPELLHFVYKPLDIPDSYRQLPQFTSPLADGPYSSDAERQRLFDLYRYLHSRIHSSVRPLRLIYHVAEKETLLAWVTSKFELYTAFSSLVTKVGAINVITKLLRWIKKEEDRLFIRYPPKYSTTPLPGKGAKASRPERTEPAQNGFFTGL
ncbi:vacuolar fusion protein MON1 homolog B-like isoform X2 [Spea bombifrons]|uniref:vacuolar fusion protein MON1 homolog B-like isoform X2 n=1 Tax=Spea bombifrons TaxID=233779 RepID=UPI0023490BDE|nr:vacuolar fusion protein MON1 homolog B-like isoform X2 [Spea bombifrons]